MVVFDDGLVVVPGGKTAFVGMWFGALGGAVAGGAAKKALANRLAVIDALGPGVTAAQAAEAAKGTWLVAPSQVQDVKIAKSRLQGCKLTIHLTSKTLKLNFAPNRTPVATVVGLLQPLLGDRLEVDPGVA